MALKLVKQEHYEGCFIACVAMMLKLTYFEAFMLIHPSGFPERVGLSREKSIDRLIQIGLHPVRLAISKPEEIDKTALIILRWKKRRQDRVIYHSIAFDRESNLLLDPSCRIKTWLDCKRMATLDSAYYFKGNYETI